MRPQTGPELLELCRALSVPLAEVDREGVIRDCSEALAELLQCAPGELKGRALIEFSPAPEELIAVHEETLRAGAARDQLLSLRGPKGDEVAVGVSTLAQRDAAGAVTGYLLAVRDSPARKRAEEDFRRDERRLESLLRIAQYQADDVDDLLRIALEEAIVLTDSRVGYIFHYNEEKREFRLSNRSRDVMAECSVEGPQAVYQLDSTGLWGEVVRQRRAIMVNDFAAPHPLKRGYPEGHAPLHRFLSIPVFRRNRIVMVVGVANKESVYDASDTRQLTLLMDSVLKSLEHIRDEAELRKLSRAVEHSPTTIVITGLDGKIEYVNPKFTEITGYTREEAIGQNPRILKSELHGAEFYRELWRTILAGEEWRGEFLNRARDGRSFWESASISPVLDDRGVIRHFVAVKEDITERKRIQLELEERNRELVELNGVKNQFLGMAAHDLRSPLSVIFDYSDCLLSGLCAPMNQEQTEFLTVIRERSEFMLRLINDLLDVTRIESGSIKLAMTPVDLAALAERTVKLNAVLSAKKGITLQLGRHGTIPVMLLDGPKIEQVLNNLIANAVKFSRPGTTTLIALAATESDVTMTFRDQGVGIPAGDLAHLFKPFRRGSIRPTAGESSTGLGLVIVKKIVESHGGTIRVESEVGKGTTVLVTLPVSRPAAGG